MTDDELRAVYRRVREIIERDRPNDASFHAVVHAVSDLAALPYGRVHEICIEED